jgi:hypothetical protein
MSTGIRCFNGASALRRQPPIADAIALRWRNVVSHSLCQRKLQLRAAAIQHPRGGTLPAVTGSPHPAGLRTIESP